MDSINVNGYGERDCKATIHQIHGRTKKETSHVCRKHQSVWNSNVIFLKADVGNRKTGSVCVLKGSED